MKEDEEMVELQHVKEEFEKRNFAECHQRLRVLEVAAKSRDGDAVDKKKAEERVRWLQGVVFHKQNSWQKAVDVLDGALLCSEQLYKMGEESPTRVCMEALRCRGVCHLKRFVYGAAIRDFKEWLQMRERFWPDADPTSTFYNLALCYKHCYNFSAARHFFEQSIESTKHMGIHQERNYKRAKHVVRLLEEMSVTPSESELIEDILNMSIPQTKACADLAAKLLSLRTRLHSYLAKTSWGLLQHRRQQQQQHDSRKRLSTSRWLGKLVADHLSFSATDTPERPSSSASYSHEEARQVIVDVATSLLVRLLGGGEAKIRKYLCHGSAPAVTPLLDLSAVNTALRQTLNFTTEFTLNFASMHVWQAVQLTRADEQQLVLLEEYPECLPFLSGNGQSKKPEEEEPIDSCYVCDQVCDGEEPLNHVEALESLEPEQEKFVPQLFGLAGEKPLLDKGMREQLCRVLPARNTSQNWKLVFSTRRDGFSMSQLLRNAEDIEDNIIVVQTVDGDTFGGYSACPWQPQKYNYGNGETMVFSWKPGAGTLELCCWQWTGKNRFFVMCEADSLSFGGGKTGPALSLDGATLKYGHTNDCESFNNCPLASESPFIIKCVECWAFID